MIFSFSRKHKTVFQKSFAVCLNILGKRFFITSNDNFII